MARLIDADKLKSDYDITNWEEPYGCSFKVIDRQPTVDAEPVRYGEWIETHTWNGFTRVNRYTCSLCGHNTDRLAKTNFCPGCGAKMEEESDNG